MDKTELLNQINSLPDSTEKDRLIGEFNRDNEWGQLQKSRKYPDEPPALFTELPMCHNHPWQKNRRVFFVKDYELPLASDAEQ